MDFKKLAIQVVADAISCMVNAFMLAVAPYKTMRRISQSTDFGEVYALFVGVCAYMYVSHAIREYTYEPFVLLIMIVFHYAATIIFFYIMGSLFQKENPIPFAPFINTIAYTLIPTLTWFIVNTILFLVLPPPRHMTLLGTTFSIVFISFSVVMLMWKILILYIALRFSTRLPFFRLFYLMVTYIAIIIPYSILLYEFQFFRVPFL